MIVDSTEIQNNSMIEMDVCIAGAGVAGIPLARELGGSDFKVCLLESGGFEPDRVTQSLYWGENAGFPYYPLDTSRARFFGGSSNCWHIPIGDNLLGARMRPLDPIDFEKREWVPYSGWPFDKKHLDPFYEKAQALCRMGRFAYDAKDWSDSAGTPTLPFLDGRVKTTMFQFVLRDLFFREYRDDIRRSGTITSLLHSNVTEIETNRTGDRVARLHVSCFNGKRFAISAKLFILALGAIETPRLLMLSDKVQKTGLGNQNDLVGRFFMEHPHLWSGLYIPSSPELFRKTGLYGVHRVDGVPVMGKLTLSEEVIRQERMLNYVVSIHPRICAVPYSGNPEKISVASEAGNPEENGENIMADLGKIARSFCRKIGGRRKIRVFALNHMSEQMPNPDSRVTLMEECDALGQRRARLDWRMTSLDMKTIIRGQQIVDEELRRAGLGRLHIEMRREVPPPNLTGGWHHMGTTRMHADPRQGVVDENCRVHGVSNLFIAGPSVFPTVGYANPALTIVALSLRLADHIKKRIAAEGGN